MEKQVTIRFIDNEYWDNGERIVLVFSKGYICEAIQYSDGKVCAESQYYEGISDYVNLKAIEIL